jgi:hypothetical protein
MEEMFSTWSAPRSYNQDQLAVAARELLAFSRCGLLLLPGQFGKPEEGEHPPLEAANK